MAPVVKIDLSNIRDRVSAGANGCWIWQRSLDTSGYGKWKNQRAHRLVYEALIGPIPDGLVLDHLCRNRACVNPAHLEPVTQLVNIRRGANAAKTHCKNGHEFDEVNTRIVIYRGRPSRACRKCNAAAARRYQESHR